VARKVLIIGGGTGGTVLANSLSRRRFDVTVVAASAAHMFQPALLYVAFRNAGGDMVRSERDLLRPHVELLEATVTHVDLESHVVTTTAGDRLGYDDIVLATGITTDPAQIPGLAQTDRRVGNYHSTVEQARRLWASLEQFRGGTIAVGQATPICKCPPSPLEGVLLADRLLRERGIRDRTRLVFFTPYPRAYPAAAMNEVVEPVLAKRGVEVMTFFDVDRVDPDTGTIHSIEGDEIAADLPLVIPPFMGADITYTPSGVLDPSRFVITDRNTLRVKGADHAFAIGDGTNLPTSKAGVGAHLEAKVVAAALEGRPTSFAGRTHCPFDLGDGTGTFVISSYETPAVRTRPSRVKHVMKMAFARLYWVSLRGPLDPVLDAYFRLTRPRPVTAGR
jgi:sulfide:quinone oxidoreductase